MPYNPSLAKFKSKMQDIKAQMRGNLHQALLNTAEEIADNMRSAAPKLEGTLAASVRTVDVSKITAGSARYSVKIKAGGPSTFRRDGKSGQVYDYSAAIESGTRKMDAEPFFYNTWRRYRSSWPDVATETAKQTIELNKKIIADRASGIGRIVGGRSGGVVIGNGK